MLQVKTSYNLRLKIDLYSVRQYYINYNWCLTPNWLIIQQICIYKKIISSNSLLNQTRCAVGVCK